uniref:Uncharacterized protein n=1 Tax=Trichuris muris TaxID=70415 RepID=A0A5S6Q723_TRIMR
MKTLSREYFVKEEEKAIKGAQMEQFATEILACKKTAGRSYIPKTGALQRKQVFMDQKSSCAKRAGRNAQSLCEYRKRKRWRLIFICLTTRAVNLEDCISTSDESLLSALERFIQRRVRR